MHKNGERYQAMKLVGALSSPYTRRVTINLSALGLVFEHEPVSVFSELPKFRAINPVVRAPTVLLDDNTLLMESNVEAEALPVFRQWPHPTAHAALPRAPLWS